MGYRCSVHYRLAGEEGLTGKGLYWYEFAEYSNQPCVGELSVWPFDAMWSWGGKHAKVYEASINMVGETDSQH